MTTEARRKWSTFAWTALSYIVVFLLVFPVLWMALTGFKTEIAAISVPPILFFQPTLDQFLLAIQGGFGAYVRLRSSTVKMDGACRRDPAGISSDKEGENPSRRKSKVS